MIKALTIIGFWVVTAIAAVGGTTDYHISDAFTLTVQDGVENRTAALDWFRRFDRLVRRLLHFDSRRRALPYRVVIAPDIAPGSCRWRSVDGEFRLSLPPEPADWSGNAAIRRVLLTTLLSSRLGIEPVANYDRFPVWVAEGVSVYMDQNTAREAPLKLTTYPALRELALAGIPIVPGVDKLTVAPDAGSAEVQIYREYALLTVEIMTRISDGAHNAPGEYIALCASGKVGAANAFGEIIGAGAVRKLRRTPNFEVPENATNPERAQLALVFLAERALFNRYFPLPTAAIKARLAPILRVDYTVEKRHETTDLARLPFLVAHNNAVARLPTTKIRELNRLSAGCPMDLQRAIGKLVDALARVGRGETVTTAERLRDTVQRLHAAVARQQALEDYLMDFERRNLPMLDEWEHALKAVADPPTPLPPKMDEFFRRAAADYLK